MKKSVLDELNEIFGNKLNLIFRTRIFYSYKRTILLVLFFQITGLVLIYFIDKTIFYTKILKNVDPIVPLEYIIVLLILTNTIRSITKFVLSIYGKSGLELMKLVVDDIRLFDKFRREAIEDIFTIGWKGKTFIISLTILYSTFTLTNQFQINPLSKEFIDWLFTIRATRPVYPWGILVSIVDNTFFTILFFFGISAFEFLIEVFVYSHKIKKMEPHFRILKIINKMKEFSEGKTDRLNIDDVYSFYQDFRGFSKRISLSLMKIGMLLILFYIIGIIIIVVNRQYQLMVGTSVQETIPISFIQRMAIAGFPLVILGTLIAIEPLFYYYNILKTYKFRILYILQDIYERFLMFYLMPEESLRESYRYQLNMTYRAILFFNNQTASPLDVPDFLKVAVLVIISLLTSIISGG